MKQPTTVYTCDYNNFDKYPPMPDTKQIWIHDVNEEMAVMFHERAMEAFDKSPGKPIIVFIDS